MTTATYTCPTCGSRMERDILLFYRHTDEHILDVLKKQNPKWVTENGFCQKCFDYFKTTMGKGAAALGEGGPALANIEVTGARWRFGAGVLSFIAAQFIFLALWKTRSPLPWSPVLFIFIFGGFLCLFEAKERVCVVLGGMGERNLGRGQEKIGDRILERALRLVSLKIVLISAASALVLTFILVTAVSIVR